MNTEKNENKDVEVKAIELVDDGKSLTIKSFVTNEELFLDETNFVPMLNQVKAIAEGLVADATTREGAATIKALNRKIAGLKTSIEAVGKSVADEIKLKPKLIDKTRKRVKDTLESYQEIVMRPLVEIQNRKDTLVDVSNVPASCIGCDSYYIKSRIEELKSLHDNTEWKESKAEAEETFKEALRQLDDMKAKAEKAESDARELEQLRTRQAEFERAEREKAEAERKKAEEALNKAQEEAEAARRAQAEAEAKAKKAEEVAKAVTEGVGVEHDRETAKNELLFPDDPTAYRKAVNKRIYDELLKFTTEEKAKELFLKIVKCEIPNLRILY